MMTNHIHYFEKLKKKKKEKEHYLEIHQNHGNKSQLPKGQAEPYKPYCEVQKHQ